MTLTIADAEDSYLDGVTSFEEWRQEFEAKWFQPLGLSLLGGMMASLPPEVLANLPPDAVAQIQQKLGGGDNASITPIQPGQ